VTGAGLDLVPPLVDDPDAARDEAGDLRSRADEYNEVLASILFEVLDAVEDADVAEFAQAPAPHRQERRWKLEGALQVLTTVLAQTGLRMTQRSPDPTPSSAP
jgi:hypothetical protein